jgi:hypothetical protein
MLHHLRSWFQARAAQLFSSVALTSLSLLAVAPSAFAFSSVEEYFKKYPEQWPEFVKYMGEAEARKLVTPTVAGPSAGQIAADAASIGAGMAFPNAAGRLANIAGYSPSEIQKGLQRLADRYCLQNQVDCYGANNYIYVFYSPNNFGFAGYDPDWGEPVFTSVPECSASYVSYWYGYQLIGAGAAIRAPNGTGLGPCIDLGTLRALPRTGNPKTFRDLTPEQKRKAIGLATPADFIPNPGTFDIPDDGTQVYPNGAPILFPDSENGDQLNPPINSPLPATVASNEELNDPSGDPADDEPPPEEPVGNTKIVKDKWLKDHGVDAETEKKAVVSDPNKSSLFDIYKDEKGYLWAIRKPMRGDDPGEAAYIGRVKDIRGR